MLLKAFALEDLGYPDDFLARVGAVAGVFNCLGRIVFGVLLDRVSYKWVGCLLVCLILGQGRPLAWVERVEEKGGEEGPFFFSLLFFSFYELGHLHFCGYDVETNFFSSSSNTILREKAFSLSLLS